MTVVQFLAGGAEYFSKLHPYLEPG